MVKVAVRFVRSIDTSTYSYLSTSLEIERLSGVIATPFAFEGRSLICAKACARSKIDCLKTAGLTI